MSSPADQKAVDVFRWDGKLWSHCEMMDVRMFSIRKATSNARKYHSSYRKQPKTRGTLRSPRAILNNRFALLAPALGPHWLMTDVRMRSMRRAPWRLFFGVST